MNRDLVQRRDLLGWGPSKVNRLPANQTRTLAGVQWVSPNPMAIGN